MPASIQPYRSVKRLAIIGVALLLCAMMAQSAASQTRNVTFVHGLGQGPSVWDEFIADFESAYDVNTYAPFWSDGPLGQVAANLYVQPNAVVVGHSTGGVLAREKYRTGGNSRVADLITIGTPHVGAPIGVLALANGPTMANVWTADLTRPFAALFFCGSVLCDIAQVAVGTALPVAIATMFDNAVGDNPVVNGAAANDLVPGSPFLSGLNASPSATYPGNGSYFIYGDENFHTHLRLLESYQRALNGENPTEVGDRVDLFMDFRDAYIGFGIFSYLVSSYAAYLYYDTGDPFYEFEAARWFYVATASIYAAYRIHEGWQYEYSKYIVGNTLYYDLDGGDYAADDDGFIPNGSQAPSFIAQRRRLRAIGVNHYEETAAPAAYERIEFAMTQDDVGVQELAPPTVPLSASITGPTSVNGGQTYTWRASVSGGASPYAYEWKYRQNCPGGGGPLDPRLPGPNRETCDGTWKSGGTSSSFRKAFYGSYSHSIQLRTTDADGAVDLSTKTVTVN